MTNPFADPDYTHPDCRTPTLEPLGTEIARFKSDVPNSTPVYQSRWGYHPIGRHDFQILKTLYKMHWVSVRQAKRYLEWSRKSPQNRSANAPKFDYPFLVDTKIRLQYTYSTKRRSAIGKWRYGQILRQSSLVTSRRATPDIVRDFNLARMPVATKEEVKGVYQHMDFYRDVLKQVNK